MVFDTILVDGLCTSTSTVTDAVTVVLKTGDFTTINANFIAVDWPNAVEWQAQDLPYFTPKSAPVLARETASVSTSSRMPSSGSTPKSPAASKTGDAATGNSSHGSLSSGAGAGIGVAVTIAVLALLALLAWLFVRRCRKTRQDTSYRNANALSHESAYNFGYQPRYGKKKLKNASLPAV